MKIPAAAAAIVLGAFVLLAGGAAQGAAPIKPKQGKWVITVDRSAAPPKGAKGAMEVFLKKDKKGKKKLTMGAWTSGDFYVKCTGAKADPEEMNPGFETAFSTGNKTAGKSFPLGKERSFAYRFKESTVTRSFKGKFTSATRASGTLRQQNSESAFRCDTGDVKWKAVKK